MAKLPVVIYHGGCVDGWTSAMIAHQYFDGACELYPGVYGDPPPLALCKDANVLLVDFSYKRDVLVEIGKVAKSVLILDHHKTAEHDLREFIVPWPVALPWLPVSGIAAIFDMDRSGAGLTWDYLFSNDKRPSLVNSVEDRDLWRFNFPATKQVHAALSSYPFEVSMWKALIELDETVDGHMSIVAQGQAITRRNQQMLDDVYSAGLRKIVWSGHRVWVCNAPFFFASDLGHMMGHDMPFAATYYDRSDGKRVWSLRSSPNGVDVSEIAKRYGGGGHEHAAGFTSEGNWWPPT